MLIEFLDPQNLHVDTKIMILARILKKISGISCFGGHFVRHFVYMKLMSEINFIMLNRFFDLKNLYVATKIMCLAQILK